MPPILPPAPGPEQAAKGHVQGHEAHWSVCKVHVQEVKLKAQEMELLWVRTQWSQDFADVFSPQLRLCYV